jgi:lipid-A-disaccharide synthase
LLDFTDQILAIFPAEAEFYAERGAKVTWVGHPLLDSFQDLPERQESRRALGLDPMHRSCFWFQHHGRRNCGT